MEQYAGWPPVWLLQADSRLHPSWGSIVETLRSKDATEMQALLLADKLSELNNAPTEPGAGRGRGGPHGNKPRRQVDQLKTSTKSHITALEDLQAEMQSSWKSFEMEVKRGVQATHQQVRTVPTAQSLMSFHLS
eukprot:1178296-Prorocentrum_minimum.AAC.1